MIPRYETADMAEVWGDEARFKRWTAVEVAACEAWHARGEISADEMNTIRTKADHHSAARVREIEKTTNHDVVAFVRAVSESIGEPACRHVHRGLTSSDVVDTALAMSLQSAFTVLIAATDKLRQVVGAKAREYKNLPCVGRTHGIHAEPTTFGLRLAGWYTELSRACERLQQAKVEVSYGKLSGAVGNFSQTDPDFEAFVLAKLDLQVEPVATQVVPRDRHAAALSAVALLGATLERFATEVRHLQRTDVREVEEAFGKGQTGSSAMPHKRNPITCERLTGMARLLRGYVLTGFENVALWHDRDISHSSVERVVFPDAFHVAHYMVLKFTQVMEGLRVYGDAMAENLNKTRGLVFSQNVLGALLARGLERQTAYRLVQRNAMKVWEKEASDFKAALEGDAEVGEHLSQDVLDEAFSMNAYTEHLDALFERAGLA